MAGRKDSVDSFDDFFGVTKTDDSQKKSSTTDKPNDKSIGSIIKAQTIVRRSPTPEKGRSPSPEPKFNNKNRKLSGPSQPKRVQSAQSKNYESDFDYDNDFEDDDTKTINGSIDGKNKTIKPITPKKKPPETIRRTSDSDNDDNKRKTKNNILPSPKKKPSEIPRHISDSEDDNNKIKKKINPISSTKKKAPEPIRPLSDSDDDNGSKPRKKINGVSSPKKKTSEPTHHVSDSEINSSFTIPKKNDNIERKKPKLPIIPVHRTRYTAPTVQRPKRSASSSIKNENGQRASDEQNEKVKGLESRVAELRRQLEAQRIENATLRTIQRREEKAIKKYEEKEFDIHRVLQDYTRELDHMKDALSNERETKQRLEKKIEARDEKLRVTADRLKKFEKIVEENHLDERHELNEKLNAADKKIKEFQEKIANQEKHILNLEKNHRHQISQEKARQRDLKRQLEQNSEKYNELNLKLEDKTRQVDTMHIYAQRASKNSSDSPPNLSKSRSLQSLNDKSPRIRHKSSDLDGKRPARKPSENKAKPRNEISKPILKKDLQSTTTNTKESSNITNGHGAPKSKNPVRRLSTPRSIEEDQSEIEDKTVIRAAPKKLPAPSTIQRSEQHLSTAQIHKRPVVPAPAESKNNSASIFKLTEPPVPSKNRPKRDLDDKWSEMFGKNQEEDSTKEDLLAKLVADEQQERKRAAASDTNKRSTMNMFETSTRSTTIQPPAPAAAPAATTTVKPSVDPFESLFSNTSTKPTASRRNDFDDMFSTKPSNQTTTDNRNSSFESLFGPASTSKTSTQNNTLQRPKLATNATGSIPNRALFDEIDEFVL